MAGQPRATKVRQAIDYVSTTKTYNAYVGRLQGQAATTQKPQPTLPRQTRLVLVKFILLEILLNQQAIEIERVKIELALLLEEVHHLIAQKVNLVKILLKM